MMTDALTAWRNRLGKAAEADGMRLWGEHLRHLGLAAEPQTLLDGTLQLVTMCLVYRSMDGVDLRAFLDMQIYDPRRCPRARYVLTFDVCGLACGRVVVGRELGECDLADMHGAAWPELQLCGYSGFYITRVDGQELTAEETVRLEQLVERDLFYDYTRDELAVWFESSQTPGCMYVDVTLIDDDPDG